MQNLFQSVQLNINNPNFVIMQGKITKVLNMKAPEILSMIEEAAGTSMFEDKKDKATKTMAKKEKKMEEIQSLLREEIEPKLNRLREEKKAFLEYQKAQSEFERLSRLVVAHEWMLWRTGYASLNHHQGCCADTDAGPRKPASKSNRNSRRSRQGSIMLNGWHASISVSSRT